MQPCKTEDQPYSDASSNGECSLVSASVQIYLAGAYTKLAVVVK